MNTDTRFYLLEAARLGMLKGDEAQAVKEADARASLCHLCVVETYPISIENPYRLQMMELALRKRMFDMLYPESKRFAELLPGIAAIGIINLLHELTAGKTPAELLGTTDESFILEKGTGIYDAILESAAEYREAL